MVNGSVVPPLFPQWVGLKQFFVRSFVEKPVSGLFPDWFKNNTYQAVVLSHVM